MSETQSNRAEVVVIGAGHAGVEAALAAARMGADTVLFTMSLDAIANLPCNPEPSISERARRYKASAYRRTAEGIKRS